MQSNILNSNLTKAQQAFTNALLGLLKEKTYSEITISELAEYAQYDRRTFYRYFKTTDDVICSYCAVLLNEMTEIMMSKGTLTPESGFESFFEFWDRHKDFLLLLNKQGLLHFLGDLQTKLIYQQVGLSMHDDLPDNFEDVSEFSQFAFYFMLGGVWSVLSFWVSSGMKQTPSEITTHVLNSITQMAILIK